MLSIIVYGRNDSHGYNLHKRAAISFNSMAEVLTDPDDEILYVDCNTPDDMPTFPESIHDILTPKAKSLLRIFRLRPDLFKKHTKGTPLKALETISRNIAIRRSNPKNRWILSTNTDIVFVIRDPKKSLSDVVATTPDGFYELPRFEIPETLWESLDRTKPKAIIETLRNWGQKLHLNDAVIGRDIIRFDAPGDFQLVLREQMFQIHGFNEDMIWGWHVDSNLCKRLHLLNGETKSLHDHIFSYHCDHTRQWSSTHSMTRKHTNNEDRFIFNMNTPYIPEQADTWGIPHEKLEEIRLTPDYLTRLSTTLEKELPGMTEPLTFDYYIPESYNHGEIYDTHHTLPYLLDHFSTIPPSANIGYFGGNHQLLQLLEKSLNHLGHQGNLIVNEEMFLLGQSSPQLSERITLSDTHSLLKNSDILIFDTALMHLPHKTNEKGIAFACTSRLVTLLRKKLKKAFFLSLRSETARKTLSPRPRKFFFISNKGTWFESLTNLYIDTVTTPYSSHVSHGFLRKTVSSSSFLFYFIKTRVVQFGIQNKELFRKTPLLFKFLRFIYRKFLLQEEIA